MNKAFYLLMLGIFSASCVPTVVKQVSKEIDEKSRIGRVSKRTLSFHEVRMKYFKDESANAALIKKIDTLFVLDEYILEDATYHSKIWDSHISLNYQYRYGKFTHDSLSVFTKYMCSLVQKWDTLGIRNEEKLYSNIIPEYWIYASRVIRNNNKLNVEVIRFKSFFKLGRDGARQNANTITANGLNLINPVY